MPITHPLNRRRFLHALAAPPLLAVLGPTRGRRARAGSAPAATGEATYVATGLVNPRGFTWGADGTLYVAEAGSPGPTSGVVAIGPDGCPTRVVGGFPTARVAFRGIAGMADAAFLGADLYALFAGGDIDRDLAHNGLYRLDGQGGATLICDVSAFIPANPVAVEVHEYDSDGQPYALLPLPSGDAFLATEGNSNQVLRLGLDGSVSRVLDLSAGHPIPTGIAAAPDGGVYVALFTSAPYTEGTSRVIQIDQAGGVADVWTGLSVVTSLAVDPDGALYAAEMATGYGDDPDRIQPGTGRIVRRLATDRAEMVATGLDLPVAIDFGPDGALYVSGPTLGADDGSGWIVRLDGGAATPVPVAERLPAVQPCAVAPA